MLAILAGIVLFGWTRRVPVGPPAPPIEPA
jgi:hypothetical protein